MEEDAVSNSSSNSSWFLLEEGTLMENVDAHLESPVDDDAGNLGESAGDGAETLEERIGNVAGNVEELANNDDAQDSFSSFEEVDDSEESTQKDDAEDFVDDGDNVNDETGRPAIDEALLEELMLSVTESSASAVSALNPPARTSSILASTSSSFKGRSSNEDLVDDNFISGLEDPPPQPEQEEQAEQANQQGALPQSSPRSTKTPASMQLTLQMLHEAIDYGKREREKALEELSSYPERGPMRRVAQEADSGDSSSDIVLLDVPSDCKTSDSDVDLKISDLSDLSDSEPLIAEGNAQQAEAHTVEAQVAGDRLGVFLYDPKEPWQYNFGTDKRAEKEEERNNVEHYTKMEPFPEFLRHDWEIDRIGSSDVEAKRERIFGRWHRYAMAASTPKPVVHSYLVPTEDPGYFGLYSGGNKSKGNPVPRMSQKNPEAALPMENPDPTSSKKTPFPVDKNENHNAVPANDPATSNENIYLPSGNEPSDVKGKRPKKHSKRQNRKKSRSHQNMAPALQNLNFKMAARHNHSVLGSDSDPATRNENFEPASQSANFAEATQNGNVERELPEENFERSSGENDDADDGEVRCRFLTEKRFSIIPFLMLLSSTFLFIAFKSIVTSNTCPQNEEVKDLFMAGLETDCQNVCQGSAYNYEHILEECNKGWEEAEQKVEDLQREARANEKLEKQDATVAAEQDVSVEEEKTSKSKEKMISYGESALIKENEKIGGDKEKFKNRFRELLEENMRLRVQIRDSSWTTAQVEREFIGQRLFMENTCAGDLLDAEKDLLALKVTGLRREARNREAVWAEVMKNKTEELKAKKLENILLRLRLASAMYLGGRNTMSQYPVFISDEDREVVERVTVDSLEKREEALRGKMEELENDTSYFRDWLMEHKLPQLLIQNVSEAEQKIVELYVLRDSENKSMESQLEALGQIRVSLQEELIANQERLNESEKERQLLEEEKANLTVKLKDIESEKHDCGREITEMVRSLKKLELVEEEMLDQKKKIVHYEERLNVSEKVKQSLEEERAMLLAKLEDFEMVKQVNGMEKVEMVTVQEELRELYKERFDIRRKLFVKEKRLNVSEQAKQTLEKENAVLLSKLEDFELTKQACGLEKEERLSLQAELNGANEEKEKLKSSLLEKEEWIKASEKVKRSLDKQAEEMFKNFERTKAALEEERDSRKLEATTMKTDLDRALQRMELSRMIASEEADRRLAESKELLAESSKKISDLEAQLEEAKARAARLEEDANARKQESEWSIKDGMSPELYRILKDHLNIPADKIVECIKTYCLGEHTKWLNDIVPHLKTGKDYISNSLEVLFQSDKLRDFYQLMRPTGMGDVLEGKFQYLVDLMKSTKSPDPRGDDGDDVKVEKAGEDFELNPMQRKVIHEVFNIKSEKEEKEKDDESPVQEKEEGKEELKDSTDNDDDDDDDDDYEPSIEQLRLYIIHLDYLRICSVEFQDLVRLFQRLKMKFRRLEGNDEGNDARWLDCQLTYWETILTHRVDSRPYDKDKWLIFTSQCGHQIYQWQKELVRSELIAKKPHLWGCESPQPLPKDFSIDNLTAEIFSSETKDGEVDPWCFRRSPSSVPYPAAKNRLRANWMFVRADSGKNERSTSNEEFFHVFDEFKKEDVKEKKNDEQENNGFENDKKESNAFKGDDDDKDDDFSDDDFFRFGRRREDDDDDDDDDSADYLKSTKREKTVKKVRERLATEFDFSWHRQKYNYEEPEQFPHELWEKFWENIHKPPPL